MGIERKYIDFAADFAIFVSACFFIVSGVSRISMMQESLHHSLSDKGMSVILEDETVYISGDELIAQLSFPQGIQKVELDGAVFTGDIRNAASSVLCGGQYLVVRNVDESGNVTLIIYSITEEE